jgi:hypothetical protein
MSDKWRPKPDRVAYLRQMAQVGAVVAYGHPAGEVRGEITKVSEQSVWVKVYVAQGYPQRTIRFTLRKYGAYQQAGQGKYAPRLRFEADPNPQP